MNTETGEIYRNLTNEDFQQLARKDPRIVRVSEAVADLVEAGKEAVESGITTPTVERARISWHKKQERNGE